MNASLSAPLRLLLVALGVALTGCEYDAPLSPQPEGPIDEMVLGSWRSADAAFRVRRFDSNHYVVVCNDRLYRGWHTPVAGLRLVTLQTLEATPAKFIYMTYEVSAPDGPLLLRFVSHDVIDKSLRDPAAIRRAIEMNARNPKLLGTLGPFRRAEPQSGTDP